MGEVLLYGKTPAEIWDQHEAILSAVMSEDPVEAERLARYHISHASDTLTARLAERQAAEPPAALAPRRLKARA
jgi:DNA-binding GntR family transcriptional regulator